MAAPTRSAPVRAALVGTVILLVGCVTPNAVPTFHLQALPPAQVWLTSAFTLNADPPLEEETVAAAPFFQAWQAGGDYPTWVADATTGDVLVDALQVTLVVRATGPVVQSARFPDIMVYAGSGPAWMGYGERRDTDAFVPGQTYRVDVTVALPPGGLWISPDAPLGLKIVPVMLQQDQSELEIVVGPHASIATLHALPAPPPRGAPVHAEAEGEVTGTMYAGAAAPATTSQRFPVELPANATLLAWMNTTVNQGVPDLDLALEGPSGKVIAGSGTPTPREALRLRPENLEGAGTYQLVVTTAGSPHATFHLDWLTLS